ncbi:MAG TPA: ABC transporter substrate-binding protein [Gammaproteobacteria bacterium]|nr:ABC transporter substrate-binding protein [Gammaproteobacteria bacterium]
MAIAGLLLAASTAHAELSGGKVKITVLTDFHSDLSHAAGQGSVIAAQMALDDADGIAHRRVRIDSADDTRSARGAAALAHRYVAAGTDLFVGLAGDAPAEAVQRVAGNGRAVVMTVGATSLSLTGAYCGRTGFHWSPNLAVLMHLTDPDKRRQRRRGTVFVYGGGRRETLRNSYEVGDRNWGRNIAGQVFVSDLRQLGLYATKGMSIITPFYWNADDASRAFAARFRRQYGAPPTYIQAGVYSAVLNYLSAVSQSRSDDPATVSKALRNSTPDDVYARHARIRADGQLLQDVYLMRVKGPAEAAGVWDYLKLVEKLPARSVYTDSSKGICPYAAQDPTTGGA